MPPHHVRPAVRLRERPGLRERAHRSMPAIGAGVDLQRVELRRQHADERGPGGLFQVQEPHLRSAPEGERVAHHLRVAQQWRGFRTGRRTQQHAPAEHRAGGRDVGGGAEQRRQGVRRRLQPAHELGLLGSVRPASEDHPQNQLAGPSGDDCPDGTPAEPAQRLPDSGDDRGGRKRPALAGHRHEAIMAGHRQHQAAEQAEGQDPGLVQMADQAEPVRDQVDRQEQVDDADRQHELRRDAGLAAEQPRQVGVRGCLLEQAGDTTAGTAPVRVHAVMGCDGLVQNRSTAPSRGVPCLQGIIPHRRGGSRYGACRLLRPPRSHMIFINQPQAATRNSTRHLGKRCNNTML